jgi:cytochrome c-type biogenesis protein CcmH/NrfG
MHTRFDWLSAVAGALFGVIAGYVIGTGRPAGVAAPSGVSGAPAASTLPAQGVTDVQVQALHERISREPSNARVQIDLGNLLYDGGRYQEAIGHYRKALKLDPKNVSVSTDLGTALWYTGRADDALAQFQKSLAIDPNHPQTLFNIGVVRLEGKQDRAGAIEAWERLLAANPGYPDAVKVRQSIEKARGGLPAGS